jgi:uncharacterized membrane protein
MPIVFGGAVSVTAIVSLIRLWGHTSVNPMLWVGMALVLLGVVLVARNTPHAHAAPPPGAGEAHARGSLPSSSGGAGAGPAGHAS